MSEKSKGKQQPGFQTTYEELKLSSRVPLDKDVVELPDYL